jgi:S1/P1 Nuclease
MQTTAAVLAALWVVVADAPRPALAWNDTGHQVVAIIAWENLSAQVRQKAVALMRRAPSDAGLASLFPLDGRPLAVREREFFARASRWPDAIRGNTTYEQPSWHYRDFFWKEDGGQIVNIPDPMPPGELLAQLPRLMSVVVTPDPAQAGARAVGVAWLLHLVGDIHQPLHCSARVTDEEPRGDGGGNTFKLGLVPSPDRPEMIRESLHRYWDGAVDRAVPKRPNESASRYLARTAHAAMRAHPKASMAARLKPGQFEEWCRESLAAAQAYAYPPGLKRLEDPPDEYRGQVSAVALVRVALAGYRLAATIEELFRR